MGSIPNFSIKDEPVENQRPLKVRVIGAGYSGIYLGIRIPQRLRNIDLQIYEKNEGIGGTWWENRYPGVLLFSSKLRTPELTRTFRMCMRYPFS
jgi:cation diffusion facilitator CzcD-associated flavoprotein CzcO